MKTGKVACNYAIVRFLPYPETDEFVNVGVVVACPATHFFGFRLETQRRDRVTGFFPELDAKVFTLGRTHFREELERVRLHLSDPSSATTLSFAAHEFSRAFLDVVKPRESLFRFSGIGTRLAEDPEEALEYLFSYYVERLFAQRKEYQEAEMVNRLKNTLRSASIMGYRDGRLGNDMYEVPFPLLRNDDSMGQRFRAIKPIDLAKDRPTAITVHGDEWLAKLGHLKKMDYDLSRVLFAMQMPHDEPRNIQAAEAIIGEIMAFGAKAVRFDETDIITDFAKAD